MKEIVGTYQLNRDFGFVICDNPKVSRDIFIPVKEARGVKNGERLLLRLQIMAPRIRIRRTD